MGKMGPKIHFCNNIGGLSIGEEHYSSFKVEKFTSFIFFLNIFKLKVQKFPNTLSEATYLEKKYREPKVALLNLLKLMTRFGGDQCWFKTDLFLIVYFFMTKLSHFT